MACILISGGAGYIGSVLTQYLLIAGHQVLVVDNFLYNQAPFNHLCNDPNLEIISGSVLDRRLTKPLLHKADVFIPLAALVGAPLCERNHDLAIDVNLTAITLAFAELSASQTIVIPNTNSGYGIGESDKECTEESPLRPISHYGKIKAMAEMAVMARGNAVSLRLATVFGMSPRMRLDLLVNNFVYKAVTDRSIVLFEPYFRRNYIHVRDVARAFLYVIDHWSSMNGQVYNVGLSEANLTKWDLCYRIKDHLPEFAVLTAPIGEDPDKRDYIVSNAKIEAAGFKAIHGLDEGIIELIKGYRQFKGQFCNV